GQQSSTEKRNSHGVEIRRINDVIERSWIIVFRRCRSAFNVNPAAFIRIAHGDGGSQAYRLHAGKHANAFLHVTEKLLRARFIKADGAGLHGEVEHVTRIKTQV